MKLLYFITIVALVSCSRADDLPANMNESVISGSWRIILFTDSGRDETGDFSGYAFSFGQNGNLTATKGSVSKSGTWNKISNEFNIDLGPKTDTNRPLCELTDNWDIISITDTMIKLQDDNIASGELLTFAKN